MVEQIVVGPVATNCYVVADKQEGVGAIIDPGEEPTKIMDVVNNLGVEIVYIINTHGHIDHIGANGGVKELTGAPIMIHEADAGMLTSADRNLSTLMGCEITSPGPDRILGEGNTIMFGNIKLEVAHTPGHSPGSVCLLGDGLVFSGDTMFFDSIGRTDFPGSSYEDIMNSIKEVLLPLDDDVTVYPGHGPWGRMGEIRVVNPFLCL